MANYVTARKIVLNRNIFGANIMHQDNTITSIDLANTEFKDGDASEAFAFLTNLTSVTNFPKGVINMYATFAGCAYITNVPSIPDSVVNLSTAYNGCYNITSAPEIPNSVVNMAGTFASCVNLVTPPIIPNSVTDISWTFQSCNKLTTSPVIPEGVVNMTNTFFRCEELTTVSNIPSTVTNMYETFFSCYNLIGNIYIKSNQISNAANCFDFSTKTKNVYIPFTYPNGVNTQTYNSFTAAGYNTEGSGTLCGYNVFLKDLNSLYSHNDPTLHTEK